jgi:adenosine deaminase
VKKNLTMALCPTSNLRVKFITDMEHMKEVIQTLWKNDVKFCFNTDNPSMLRTNLKKEMGMMLEHGILDEAQLDQTNQWAFEASFITNTSDKNLYL